MTEFVQELLEDVQIGDRVRITYGSNDDKVEGIIRKITDNFITLESAEGLRAKIKVDLLTAVVALSDAPAPAPAPQPAPAPVPAVRSFVTLPEHTPCAFDPDHWLEVLGDLRRSQVSRPVAAGIDSIVSSLRDARKTNSLPSKYHTLRMKALNLWEKCDLGADYRCFYLLLGILALEGQDYFNAYEPLVRAKVFRLAACAAALAEDVNKETAFYLSALLSREPEVKVDRFIAETCVRKNDVSILSALLEIYQEDPEVCEAIAACADHVHSGLGAAAPAVKLAPDADPLTAAKTLIAAMPQSWQVQSHLLRSYEEYTNYLYPSPVNGGQQEIQDYVGVIEKFDVNGKWGFICPEKDSGAPISGQLFFHITQIPTDNDEDILLRRLLLAGRGQGLEVSFYIGQSRQPNRVGKPSATNIILTDDGLDKAERRLDAPKDGTFTGFIPEDELRRDRGIGVIQFGSKRCAFNFGTIIDPYLRAYYANCFSPADQNVSFHVVKVGPGELRALDICWVNPPQKDLDTYCGDVSEEALQAWEPLRREREQELSGTPDLGMSVYRRDPFVDLEDWVPLKKRNAKPLNWVVTPPAPKKTEGETNTNTTEKPEKPEKTVFVKTEDTSPGRPYADAARKALQENKLDEAEVNFLQALEYGTSPDAVVGDLVTLYLRQPEKLKRALDMLDKYESQLPPEKVLNLRVSTYEKLKDYAVLCQLYDEVFRTASSVSRKSHALYRMAAAFVTLGRYEEALQTCQRWEQLYQQNRYSTDAVKLRGAVPAMERQKAICYYHDGRVEEARKIATNLVRNNPTDAAANAILNGTLTANIPSQDEGNELDLMEALVTDGEASSPVSQMPRLVRSNIQGTDISEVLKTKNIKDKKYIGSVVRAKEDINTLTAKTGNTPRSRSTNLFAICRIVEDVESREGKVIWAPQYVHRLAGRAMASLGDYLVSVSSQMDTARMAYLYAIQMLPPRNGDEQDMINSYNRYLKSYFMGRSELSKYIDQQNISRNKDGINADVFVSHQLPEVLIPEYFVGMLQLLAALDDQPNRQKQLISDIYRRNETLRKMVIRQMSVFLGDWADDASLNAASFSERFFVSARRLKEQTAVLSQALHDIAAQLMERPMEEHDLAAIGSNDWHNNLCATDFSRLQKLYYILRRTQDYHVEVDFENRADCLRAAFSEAKDLLESIQKEPTAFSYDVFMPVLDTIVLKLSECREILYREYQPRLTWRESIQPFKTREGLIQVQLLVKNERNYQAADMLRVEPAIEGDVILSRESSPLNTLRGGEEREMLLTLDITEEAKLAGSFCARLRYSYRRSKTDHSVEQVTQEQTFTLVLRSEDFVPLENPFKDHIGKPMSDVNMFYGRSQQIDQMVEMLRPRGSSQMNYGRAIAMYGQTRTGKSSLLYHFQNRLKEQYGDQVVIWDMGNIGELNVGTNADNYLPTFLYTMLSIGEEALEDHEILSECVEEAELETPLTEILKDPSYATIHFTGYMRKLNRILKEQNCIIILFVDEFTYLHGLIRTGQLSGEFMKFWKAFLQDYCVFAVIAGQDDTPEFMREYPNEFACMEAMKVTYLDEIPAKQLIREPLERVNGRTDIFRNDGCVDELYRLTAGSAYLTMLLCSNLVNYLNEKGAATVTRGIVADFLEKKVFSAKTFLEENNFEPQIRERGHEELDHVNKQILHGIARLSQANGRADISKLTCVDENGQSLTQTQIQSLVDRLVDRNVLVCEANGHCWIQVKLLEQWLINTMGA